jgi:hypothetical protein
MQSNRERGCQMKKMSNLTDAFRPAVIGTAGGCGVVA